MECPELFQFTFVPHLSLRGHARFSMQRQTAAFRDRARDFRLHPELFKIAAETATFVAEVVTRYSR